MTLDPAALSAAIAAAGCPNDGVAGPFTDQTPWTLHPASDGSQWRIDFAAGVTDAQRQAGIRALASYAPVAPVPNVSGRQIKNQVTAGGYSAGLVSVLAKAGQPGGPKPDDYIYWLGIALDTAVPVDNPKVGRLLIAAGVINSDGSSAVPAFMAAAEQLPA